MKTVKNIYRWKIAVSIVNEISENIFILMATMGHEYYVKLMIKMGFCTGVLSYLHSRA